TSSSNGSNIINVNGPGALIRLTELNNVMAIGDIFEVNGTPLPDNNRIEDAIDHSMDGLGERGPTISNWRTDSPAGRAGKGRFPKPSLPLEKRNRRRLGEAPPVLSFRG